MGFGKRLMRTALTGAAVTIGVKVASEVISNHVADKIDDRQRRILEQVGRSVQKTQKNSLTIYENKLLLAKLAICVYISRADGNVNDSERTEIKTMVEQILQHDSSKVLHNEARKICNHEGSSSQRKRPKRVYCIQ